ncbi:hypothetical protein [Streptomyces sp. 2P-4]|uniref:hypothetical protein n=1 Tax=Streptomyces sp. 2P-4 TaxID=2931974 RepID=UPI00253F6F2F|nr:hypothetical protein [Streptomyces sp. 2P-4]
MLRHRLVFPAALVAAAAVLAPGAAHAAPAAPAAVTGASDPQSYTAPPYWTVRTPLGDGPIGHDGLQIDLHAGMFTAHGIHLEAAALDVRGPSSVTVEWGDGAKDTAEITEPADIKRLDHAHTYAEVGTYTVTYTVTDAAHNVRAVNKVIVTTAGAEFTAHAPTRLLDTRDGTGAAKAKVAGRSSARVKAAGNARIPAGATAVALNVTVTNTVEAGYVTAFAGKGARRPDTSNLNYAPGQTVPNLVIVPVGDDGHVELFNGGWAPVDLIADVTGYFTRSAAAGYTPLAPARLVDTREGLGTAQGQVPGQGAFTVAAAGAGKVPKGATAVALNVTATNPAEAGHLTVFPSGQSAPSTSSVNFTAGQTVANAVVVPVGADGKISVRNGSWKGADVVVDVVGYYSPDSRAAYRPFHPFRLADTREDSRHRPRGPVPARDYLPLPFTGESPVPPAGWVLNTTVTNTTEAGHLSVAPDPNTWADYQKGIAAKPERPLSSSLNWGAGMTVPNLVQTPAGPGAVIDFWNQGWQPVDVIVDCLGVYETD